MPKKKVTKVEVKDLNLFKDAEQLIEQAYYDGVRNERLLTERRHKILSNKYQNLKDIVEEQDETIDCLIDDLNDSESEVRSLEDMLTRSAQVNIKNGLKNHNLRNDIKRLQQNNLLLFLFGALVGVGITYLVWL